MSNNELNIVNNKENDQKCKLQKYNCKQKKSIRTKIDSLSKEGKIEIFKIVKKHDERFSVNKNGILFDLSKFKVDTLDEITKFLKFSDVNSKDLEADETIRNNFRDQLNS